MDTLNCIKTRRSIRKYQDSPIEWDKIVHILEAGKEAPTAGNLQHFKFIVISDAGKRHAIAKASLEQYWMATAPIHIVICALPEKTGIFFGIRGEKLYSIQNCAAAAQNMLLAAHELGLGGCWIGAFEEELVRDICGIDENGRPQIILTFGYPDEKPPRPAKLKLVDVIFIEKWWGRVSDTGFTIKKQSAGNMRRILASKDFFEKIGQKATDHGKKLSQQVIKSIKDSIKKKPKEKTQNNHNNK